MQQLGLKLHLACLNDFICLKSDCNKKKVLSYLNVICALMSNLFTPVRHIGRPIIRKWTSIVQYFTKKLLQTTSIEYLKVTFWCSH